MYRICFIMVQIIFVNYCQKGIKYKHIRYICGKQNDQWETMYNFAVCVLQQVISYGKEI